MDNNMSTQELVSALADGQLQGDALARGLEAAAADPAGWQAYHLIGDVLRSPELARATPQGEFLARLRASLAKEARPVVAVPAVPVTQVQPAAAVVDVTREPANSQRWKLVAGVASVAAVAAIGWNAVGAFGVAGPGPQLAATPAAANAVIAVGAPGGAMLRDERLDKLMAAHRQFGGGAPLQSPGAFLRNATFEGPAR